MKKIFQQNSWSVVNIWKLVLADPAYISHYYPSPVLDTWLFCLLRTCICGNTRTQAHCGQAQWAANPVWADAKSITGVSTHDYNEQHCGQTFIPDAAVMPLGHHCKRGKPLRGNKHLSCANWSVKCTNCGGEGDVSAGVTALGPGAMSGPGISCGAHPPPSPPPALLRAKGRNGNYYLLDICLISSYSSWLAIIGPQGVCCPPLCHRWGAAVAKQSLVSI